MSSLQFILKLGNQLSGPAKKMADDLKKVHGRLVEGGGYARIFETAVRTGMRRSASSMEVATTRAHDLTRAIHGTASAARSLASRLTSLPSLVTAGALGLGAKSVIDAANFRENTLIAFSTMLKSKEAGQRIMNEAVRFAAVTPFQTGDVIDAYQKLLAFQFKPKEIPVVMKAIGDVAALKGMDKGVIDRLTLAMGQIRAKGKLQIEELMQVVEAGGPGMGQVFDIIGKKIGKTREEVTKLVSAGQISSDLGLVAVLEGIRDTLSGGKLGSNMAQMATTAKGLASTLASRPLEMFMNVDQTKGFGTLKGFLANLVDLTDTTKTHGMALRDALVSLAGTVLQTVFGPLESATKPGKFDMGALVAGIRKIEQAIRVGWPKAIAFIKDFGSGFADGLGVLRDAWAAVKPIVLWVGNLVARLMGVKGGAQSVGRLAGLLVTLLPAILLVGGPIFGFIGMVSKLLLLLQIGNLVIPGLGGKLAQLAGGPFIRLGVGIGKLIGFVGTFIVNLIRLGAAWIVAGGPIVWIIAAIVGIGIALVWAYQNVAWFRDGVNAAWRWIQVQGQKLLDWFKGLPEGFAMIGQWIVDGIRNGFSNAWSGFKIWLGDRILDMEAAVKKKLGIASPSRVFARLGRQIPAGLAVGIVAGSPLVGAAMGAALPAPTTASAGARAGGGFGPITFNITVNGGSAPQQVAAAVEQVARESIVVQLERLARELGA